MANRSLGALTVDLILKMGGFKQGMDKAEREVARASQRLQASFGKVTRALGAVGLGVSFVGLTRGLASAAQQAIEYGDSINKASIRSGVGAQAFSELAYAAKQNDIELESLTGSFTKLQKVISEAGSGSKSALEAFRALGIEFKSFRALSPDKQFELIAEQISRMRDPADKARAAVELFGRAGAELLPLFEQGAEGIRKAREEAQRLGASMTEEQVKRLAEADDAIKRMGQSWQGLARTLTAEVAPGLTAVLNRLTEIATQKKPDLSWVEELAGVLVAVPGLKQLAQAQLGATFNTGPLDDARSGGPSGRFARGVTPPRPPGFLPEPPKVPGGGKIDAATRDGLEEITVTARQITVGAVEQMYRDLDKATQTSIEQQLGSWQEFQAQLDELFASGRITAEVYNARSQAMTDEMLEPITITAEKIFPKEEQTQLGVFFEEASRGMQNVLADFLFNPFEDGIKGMLQSFGQMLQRMAAEAIAAQIAQKIFGTGGAGSGGGWLGQLASLGMSMWGGTSAASSQLFGQMAAAGNQVVLPKYADGGYIRPGRLAIVGERGPEIAFGGSTGLAIGALSASPSARGSGGMVVNNHFTVHAPTGSVSRATEMQIAAAAARGAARASARNN